MAERDEGNWLDDAFDEKKEAEEREQMRSSGTLGCLMAVVAVLAFAVVIGLFVGIDVIAKGL